MKVGIITFWQSEDNYGQILQCYALQQFLREQGNEPYLIKYKETCSLDSKRPKFRKCLNYLLHFQSYFHYFIQRLRERKYELCNDNVARDFKGFFDKHITATEEIYTEESIMSNPPKADVYICGSDQIWGGSEIYYLSFVPEGKPKIAYAPSMGGVNPFIAGNGDRIKRLIMDLDFIGMRESQAADLLHRYGISKATTVVDPTLLLSKNIYTGLIQQDDDKTNENNAFVYLLGSPIVCSVNEIFKAIKAHDLTYTYVASQGRVDKFLKQYLTIPQWINTIRTSQIVITNSFHCVVFALTFNVPFVFIPLSGAYSRMNGRLEDLLAKVNLMNRIYKGDFDILTKPIDFSTFEEFKKREYLRTVRIFSNYLT